MNHMTGYDYQKLVNYLKDELYYYYNGQERDSNPYDPEWYNGAFEAIKSVLNFLDEDYDEDELEREEETMQMIYMVRYIYDTSNHGVFDSIIKAETYIRNYYDKNPTSKNKLCIIPTLVDNKGKEDDIH